VRRGRWISLDGCEEDGSARGKLACGLFSLRCRRPTTVSVVGCASGKPGGVLVGAEGQWREYGYAQIGGMGLCRVVPLVGAAGAAVDNHQLLFPHEPLT